MQQQSTLYVASWIVLGSLFSVLTIALGYVTRQWAVEGGAWSIPWIVLAAAVFGLGSIALLEVVNSGSGRAARPHKLAPARPYVR